MASTQLTRLTGIILALQFAAFGWRVNREISVSDRKERIWLPLPDLLNIAALFSIVWFCIVVPLASGEYVLWSRRTLAAAGVLIAFHPLTMAAHYGLPYRKQRPIRKNGALQYATLEEIITLVVSLVVAFLAVRFVG